MNCQEILDKARHWELQNRRCLVTIDVPLFSTTPRGVIGYGIAGQACGVVVIEPDFETVRHQRNIRINKIAWTLVSNGLVGEWFTMIEQFEELKTAEHLSQEFGFGILRITGKHSQTILIERESKPFTINRENQISTIVRNIARQMRA